MNNRQLYAAFNNAKKVYGCTSVHVQLIARQLGILASEVVEYVMANPSLVNYAMKSQESGYSNPVMGNEYTGMYILSVTALPYLTTESIINEGATSPTLVLDLSADSFKTTHSENLSNWEINVGTTGLTAASFSKSSKTLTFSGTAKRGTITIKVKAAGMTGGVATDVLTFDVNEVSLDYATVAALATRMTAAESAINTLEDAYLAPPVIATEDKIYGGAVNPVIDVTLTKDTFKDTDCETVANWILQSNLTGLTIDSISKTSDTEAEITFTGTAIEEQTVNLIALKECFDSERTSSEYLEIETEAQPEISTLDDVVADDEDPSIDIDLEGDTFVEGLDADDFTFVDLGDPNPDTGLVLDSITYVSGTKVTVVFDGTPVDGKSFTLQAKASALTNGFAPSKLMTVTIDPAPGT